MGQTWGSNGKNKKSGHAFNHPLLGLHDFQPYPPIKLSIRDHLTILTTLPVQNSALQKIGHMTKPEIYETTRPLAPMKAYMDKACTQHRHHGHPCAQLWPTRPDGPLTFKGSGEPCGISSVTMPTSFLLSNAPSQQPQAVVKVQPTDRIFGASLRPHQRISILRTSSYQLWLDFVLLR